MKRFSVLVFIMISIMLSSCKTTNDVFFNITEPAPVFVSKDVQNIGIINRYKPESLANKTLDEIEKVLSMEGKELDKNGSRSAIEGLVQELNNFNRFEKIIIIDDLEITNDDLAGIRNPLKYDLLDELKAKYDLDAIIELTEYDTGTDIDMETLDEKDKSILNIFSVRIRVNTTIRTSWRFYDLLKKHIVDEFSIDSHLDFTGTGANPIKALKSISQRNDAVYRESSYIGRDYADRYIPYESRVKREYYVRGTDKFKTAKRRAQTGNWDGAAELWEMEVANSEPKIAGRACYNMAIINEINGNLEEAIKWASKAYVDYENKNALYYLKTLKQRKNKLEKLDE